MTNTLKTQDFLPSWGILFSTTVFLGLALVYGSLVPLNFRPLPLDEGLEQFRQIRDLNLDVGNRADWLANLFLYIPLGLLGAVTVCRLGQSMAWWIFSTIIAAVLAIALAFAVEFAQLWFPPRTVSQNDLRAEAIGACVGAGCGFIIVNWGWVLARHLGVARNRMLNHWGIIYLTLLLVYSLLPGDLIISREEFMSKLEQGRISLTPFASLDFSARAILNRCLHIACFVPVGYLVAQKYRPAARLLRKTIRCSLMGGAGFAVVIETLQLPIYSRETSIDAVFFGALGASLGGVIYFLIRRPDERPAWLVWLINASLNKTFWQFAALIYVGVIFAMLLAPFQWVDSQEQRLDRWQGLFSVPFAKQYISTEFAALTNILQKGIVFTVLGMMLKPAFGSDRVVAFCFAIVSGFCLGAFVEVGQVYIAAHEPDITDILIYTFFTGVGYYCAGVLLTTIAFSS